MVINGRTHWCFNSVLKKKEKWAVRLLSINRTTIRKTGEPPEIRTPDTLLKRQVLCRLS